MGSEFKFSCWGIQPKQVAPVTNNARSGTSEGGSSDEEEDDDDEASTASHSHPHPVTASREDSNQATPSVSSTSVVNSDEKTAIPLVDYILNVVRFVDNLFPFYILLIAHSEIFKLIFTGYCIFR